MTKGRCSYQSLEIGAWSLEKIQGKLRHRVEHLGSQNKLYSSGTCTCKASYPPLSFITPSSLSTILGADSLASLS